MLCIGLEWSAVQCSAVQYSVVQCSAVQCSAMECSTIKGSAVQCSVVQGKAVAQICGRGAKGPLEISQDRAERSNVLEIYKHSQRQEAGEGK